MQQTDRPEAAIRVGVRKRLHGHIAWAYCESACEHCGTDSNNGTKTCGAWDRSGGAHGEEEKSGVARGEERSGGRPVWEAADREA